MKTAAIIRIVVGAVAAVLLLILLVSVLSGRTMFHNGRIDIATESVPAASALGEKQAIAAESKTGGKEKNDAAPGKGDAPKASVEYASGDASVPMDQVDRIEIEWVAGEVKLAAGTGDAVTFSESSAKPLTDKQTLRYAVRENKLIVSYCESTSRIWDWLDLDKLNMPSKDLTLTVPAALMDSLREIQVDAVSATVSSTDVRARKFQVESVSGDILISGMAGEELETQSISGHVEITDMDVRELDMETVSGSLSAAGKADSVDTEATSGSTALTLDAAPRKLDMDSVSGKIRVYLPASADDFTAALDSVSGDLSCDFPSVLKNGRFTVGGGGSAYQFETVSGDVELIKR